MSGGCRRREENEKKRALLETPEILRAEYYVRREIKAEGGNS